MLVFVKFGGSVITDKTAEEAPNLAAIRVLASDLQVARTAHPDLQFIVGHGSGSFGHVYARRYGIHAGLAQDEDWIGYALTAAAALRLNRIVIDELLAAGLPALALQPSTTLRCHAGVLERWDTEGIQVALQRGLVPVIHGDVSFDTVQGCAIVSTEQLLIRLTQTPALRPDRVVLVGEAGVFTADPHSDPHARLIPFISAKNIDSVLKGTGASHGIDVTGGMRSKIELMWQLVTTTPGLIVQLIGPQPGLLEQAIGSITTGLGTTIALSAAEHL